MAETLLQTFLNNQFIKTSNTENINGLLKAVTALKKILSTKRGLLLNHVLVALDPLINEDDPIVFEVERLIIKNWPTFKNSTSTKDKATTYVRVVILQTLIELSKDEHNGAVIWLTGRNVISYYKLQKEKDIIPKILQDIGSQFEINSRRYWNVSLPAIEDLNEFSASLTVLTNDKISVEDMIILYKKATVYKGWKDQGGVGGYGDNPSYPHNGNWEWAKFFSEKAGTDLATILNKIAENQSKALNSFGKEFEESLNTYFSQVSSFFSEIKEAVNQSAFANSKRSILLWWKQALYSNRLNKSYRDQSLIVSSLVMALDISELIGSIYPESTNYLLREALYDVYGELVYKEEKFENWINLIQEENTLCKSLLFSYIDESLGRKPLLTALANLLTSTDYSFSAMTGIDGSQKISLSDFTVWLLHDIQARKISLTK